jgi:nitroimidazol reductase NimA-like FMN-containing flavoprotein (pyridoxamine 5'-phosphate oxidase superfamily)
MTIDDLGEYGVVRMDDDEIGGFLSSQTVGVLGLPTEDAPSMRPLSFFYDGESALYLLYVVGSQSRKADLSDQSSNARFLVYRAETAFNWRSVLLTGHIDEVPEDEQVDIEPSAQSVRRPELFERATTDEATKLYRFSIEERTGIKHAGLPPGFETDSSEESEP